MSNLLKAAFIFVAPNADAGSHHGWVKTDQVEVKTIAVANYQQACALIDGLVAEGMVAVELCGGFGHKGVAAIAEAAEGRLAVGAVRFDNHPGLEFASGDRLFS